MLPSCCNLKNMVGTCTLRVRVQEQILRMVNLEVRPDGKLLSLEGISVAPMGLLLVLPPSLMSSTMNP